MPESAPSQASLELVRRLIAFDTVSRNSNLELIDFVQGHLRELGVSSTLVRDDAGGKANLYATLGPEDRPGIALSGHTDVVPVDGQPWTSDPFTVEERDGRLYGRGTSDMKSFIAICLALAPEFLARDIHTPIHLAFSYDEEIGCLGVRPLIAWLEAQPIRPRGVVIGEPTSMKVMRAHKGKLSQICTVHGHESHSGMAHLGANAVEAAAEAIAFLKSMARRHRDEGPYDEELTPAYTTIHTGVIEGGTQLNIVPRRCRFEFEFRHLPEVEPESLLAELEAHVDAHILPELQAVSPECRFEYELRSQIPGLDAHENDEIVQLALALTGENTTGKVSFGTEGGLFQQAGMPAVICGPGSIEQAHKPDEWVTLAQLGRCEAFLRKLFDRLAS